MNSIGPRSEQSASVIKNNFLILISILHNSSVIRIFPISLKSSIFVFHFRLIGSRVLFLIWLLLLFLFIYLITFTINLTRSLLESIFSRVDILLVSRVLFLISCFSFSIFSLFILIRSSLETHFKILQFAYQ